MSRRWAWVRISADKVVELLREGRPWVVMDGLPKTAQAVSVHCRPESNEIDIKLEHEDFMETPERGYSPLLLTPALRLDDE